MKKIMIRRGYGAFVRCKNEVKARRKAAHWHRTGQGDRGAKHPVIGLFVKGITESHRTVLFS